MVIQSRYAYLLHLQRRLDLRDIALNVSLQTLEIYRLPYWARHVDCYPTLAKRAMLRRLHLPLGRGIVGA